MIELIKNAYNNNLNKSILHELLKMMAINLSVFTVIVSLILFLAWEPVDILLVIRYIIVYLLFLCIPIILEYMKQKKEN